MIRRACRRFIGMFCVLMVALAFVTGLADIIDDFGKHRMGILVAAVYSGVAAMIPFIWKEKA